MKVVHTADNNHETIAAIATAPGIGGIAVIRISGSRALEAADQIWKGKKLSDSVSHHVHYGKIVNENNEVIDEGVATVFRAPNSFTGEDVVELSIHGSKWIQQEVLNLLSANGVRGAGRGEFTQRAFMNGKIDLAQAESIADLIAADSKAAHRLAMYQLKGDYSRRLTYLRENLINIASLIELELDFSEEDVEFANRQNLIAIATELLDEVSRLARSYKSGKVFKEGVPVVIAGIPNAGKSTLLNALVEDDKAIVTDIPGTTRDLIEEKFELEGILFRIIDTAGLRETSDKVERIGVERSRKAILDCRILIWINDPTQDRDLQDYEFEEIRKRLSDDVQVIHISSKSDIIRGEGKQHDENIIRISAKSGEGLEELSRRLVEIAGDGHDPATEILVTNVRHYESLTRAEESIERILSGLASGVSGDFIAQDIRETMHHLSSITGEITTTTLLSTIFSRFCIGK